VTIGKGHGWGERVARPDDLRIVADDADLAAALTDPDGGAVGLAGGDLHATLGAPAAGDRAQLTKVPIDLVEVRLDDHDPVVACAHVVAHRPWWRGGWLRGRLLIAMNAEFLGPRDLAPRGHPNDGRIEVIECDESMSIRQRLVAARRSRRAAHLPHPALRTRSIRHARWDFDRPHVVRIDGRRAATARAVELQVCADAATLYA
jgi:hypothetical protein